MAKMNIKKGDKVKVLTGKDRGAEGTVLATKPSSQRVTVEKVNIIKKAMRPTQANPEGGIASMEAPIHVSNLNVVDPKTGKPTRIGRKANEEGALVRYSKKSGEEIK